MKALPVVFLAAGYINAARAEESTGHISVPLLDISGNKIQPGSTAPYSARNSCGECHDVNKITNGYHHQQGRTNAAGKMVMKDDFFGDHRDRSQSDGRFGRWSQVTNWMTSSKRSAKSESDMGLSASQWIRDCGGCHPGGGMGEFDRDGKKLFDETTGKFGYQLLGKKAKDVRLDGDYSEADVYTGEIKPVPWDKTGLSGPDCLSCHRTGTYEGKLAKAFIWRKATINARENLKNNAGEPIRAFAAAPTAGQGWFSNFQTRKEGVAEIATVLQIDYNVGLTDGSLIKDKDGNLRLSGKEISRPADRVCVSCHGPRTAIQWLEGGDVGGVSATAGAGSTVAQTAAGKDVHYRYFNHLDDKDTSKHVNASDSRTCTQCHLTRKANHSFGKGREFMGSQNDAAWKNFLSCPDCHLSQLGGKANANKRADAPEPVSPIHSKEKSGYDHLGVFSCQACHNPKATLGKEAAFIEPTRGGAVWPQIGVFGLWTRYFSADPLNPSSADKSFYNPALLFKQDSDGKNKLFPALPWLNIYWGDWDQKAKTILPIPNWRIYQVIPKPLPVVTDDDGDGQLEVNRPEEILAYITALKGNDRYGKQIAKNPVLVKGPWVWYEDPKAPKGVSNFPLKGSGIPVKWTSLIYGQSHQTVPAKSLVENGKDYCSKCHASKNDGKPTDIMDRKVLVDPYDAEGKPVYQTVRELSGLNPK